MWAKFNIISKEINNVSTILISLTFTKRQDGSTLKGHESFVIINDLNYSNNYLGKYGLFNNHVKHRM